MSVKYYVLFGFVLLALSFYFDYHKIISLKPCSTHTWRQADGASIAANYYRDDLKFFKPRIHNRQTGSEGYTAGEFTGTYWLAGLCYKIFGGVNDAFLRGIHLLIFFGGLFGLLKMSCYFLEDIWLSFCVALLFFAAPVLTFYANNFLPDAPAFGFLLMGWAAFFDYAKTRKSNRFWWAFVLFALAGLMKITMLMSVTALGLLFVLEWSGWVRFDVSSQREVFPPAYPKMSPGQAFEREGVDVRKLFPKPIQTALGFALVLVLVGSWYVYLRWYKAHHGNVYFFAQLKAIWSGEDMNLLVYTLYRTVFFWSKYYFLPLVHLLVLPLIFVVFLGRRSPGNLLYALSFFTFAGTLSIYLMWFYQFIDHDYYVISLYIFPVFLLLSGLVILKKYFIHIYNSLFFKIIIIIFLCINIFYAKQTMNDRYGGYMDYRLNEQLAEPEFHIYLNELGITRDTWVISVPGNAPNATLYLLDRPGFTEWIDRTGSRPNVEVIRDWQARGARYLIVNKRDYLEKPVMQPFLDKEIGRYKEVTIFDMSK